MHRKTIIAFPPIDEITDSAVIRASETGEGGKKQKKYIQTNGRGKKSRELHNFYNREILNDDDPASPSARLQLPKPEGCVCIRVYTHIYIYTYTIVRYSNGVRRVFNDPGSNRPEI